MANNLNAPTPPLITVARFTDAMQAHIARGRLQAEGIAGHIADEHYITMNWFLSNALGGVKLQVEKADADRAKNLLNDIQSGDFAIDEVISVTAPIICPQCGSHTIKLIPHKRHWALVVFYFFCVPIAHREKYICRKCHFTWKPSTNKKS